MSNGTLKHPSRKTMARVLALVTLDLQPTRRLPSDSVLMLIALLVFIVFSLIVGSALGISGFQHLSTEQRWIYYVTVLGCGAVLAVALAPQIVPGAKRRISAAWATSIPLLWMGVCASFIFPDADMDRFVSLGFPCLRAGLLCAAGSGFIALLLMRRGYLVTPFETAGLSAVFSGFTGVAVLALHCPVQNWVHVVVWHLGAPLLSALAIWIGWQLQVSWKRP